MSSSSESIQLHNQTSSSSLADVIVLDCDDCSDDDDDDDDVAFVGTSQSQTVAVGSAAKLSNTNNTRGKKSTLPFFTPFHLYASRSSVSSTANAIHFQTNDGGTSAKYFRTLRQMIGFDDDNQSTIRNKKKYQWLAIFNFLIDFSYLFENLMPEIIRFHRVVVFYGTDTDQEDETTMNRWRQLLVGTGNTVEFIKLIPSDPPRSKTNPLSMKIPYGVHHTKMFLMGYHDEIEEQAYCRVVVQTANLIKGDIEYKTQGAYCQDFPMKQKNKYKKPRVEQRDDRNSDSGWPYNEEEEDCQFEEDLITYLESYRYLTRQTWCTNSSFLSDKPMSWLQLLRQYDYSTAYAILIPSVPGRHKSSFYNNFGYLKLRRAIIESTSAMHNQNHEKQTTVTTPPTPIICQISSIGSLNEKWLDQFLSAIDSLSTHNLDPTCNIASSGKSKKAVLSSRLKIIWPTTEEIRTSIEGYRGGNSVPGKIQNLSKEFLQPLFHRWSIRRNPSGANMKRTDVCNDDPLNTAHHVPHVKMIIQPSSTNRVNDDEIEWLVLTSHNLSMAAWGQIQKCSADGIIRINDEKVLFIRSWELGVFISPATLLTGSRCGGALHPPSGNKLCIRPYRGKSVSSSDTVINIDSDDDTNHNACNVPSVLFVPIPFNLRPDRYDGNDVAWAVDRRCFIPDALGCIMP